MGKPGKLEENSKEKDLQRCTYCNKQTSFTQKAIFHPISFTNGTMYSFLIVLNQKESFSLVFDKLSTKGETVEIESFRMALISKVFALDI